MKRFSHLQINDKVSNNFNLKTYKRGKSTYFYKIDKSGFKNEIGFIEQIGKTKKYLQTILVVFFDFENKALNDKIVSYVEQLYTEQKYKIDKHKQGVNVCLELRGNNICKAKLI